MREFDVGFGLFICVVPAVFGEDIVAVKFKLKKKL